MSDITSLIEKLEGASGPSIALDAEICWELERDRATLAYWRGAMGLPRPLPDEFSRLPRGLGMVLLEAGSPNYTASFDAALALAERVLPKYARIELATYVQGSSHHCRVETEDGAFEARSRANHPALALCAAILRASNPEGEA